MENKNNKKQKEENHVSSISKQMVDFLDWAAIALLPVEWRQTEKQDKFLSHLYELFDIAYKARNQKAEEIFATLDFLSSRRIIPLFIISVICLIGQILMFFELNPMSYSGVFFAFLFSSLCFAKFFLNKYDKNIQHSTKILENWCLDGAEHEISKKMRKFVEENS